MTLRPATLYVVATPIGNLGDITGRAIEVLRGADIIYAEDTRHSSYLLQHYSIKGPVQSLHEHNEQARAEHIVAALQAGGTAALISDAGTPLISDPGYRLVALCHSAGVAVSPLPGPSALTAALSVCGLPTSSVLFVGFPPAKSAARLELFKALADEKHTLAFYESRHRIVDSLQGMAAAFGADRQATLAREISKTFETIRRASLGELLDFVSAASEQQKGEFVLLVAASEVADEEAADREINRVLRLLLKDLSVKRSAEVAAELTGCKRRHAYSLALALRDADAG